MAERAGTPGGTGAAIGSGMQTRERPLAVVAGATGYIGRHVVVALARNGWRVRAIARSPAKLEPIRDAVHEVFEAEATRPGALRGACKGADAVFSSLGYRSAARKPSFWAVDRDANLALLEEALRERVGRFGFVSVFGGPEARSRVQLAEAREQVADAMLASGVPTVVLRPTGLFNDVAGMFDMARGGRFWLLGDGSAELNPVHAADVADALTAAWAQGRSGGIDIGGPEVFSQRAIGALAFEALGTRPRFGRMPLWSLDVARALLRPFHGNLATLLDGLGWSLRNGGVAPALGHRRLAPFFARLVLDREGALLPDPVRLEPLASTEESPVRLTEGVG